MLNWGILLVFLTVLGLSFYKFAYPAILKRKAQLSLQNIIFPDGENQKREILRLFHHFTKYRFTDDQILDYFIKIKGLQNLTLCKNTNFWTKKYLLSPTMIRLNYFEQVKFYELFMNYSGQKNKDSVKNNIARDDKSGPVQKKLSKNHLI